MGGPYQSKTASVGGLPTNNPDIPVCSVFIVLFMIGAGVHFTIMFKNLKRGHKFHLSGMIGGFCMARIVTCIMRIVWSQRQRNAHIAIAANIFYNAGIVLIYVVNFVLAQRLVRAAFPSRFLGKILNMLAYPFYTIILLMVSLLITALVQQSYSLNPNSHRIDRDIQFAVITFLLTLSASSFVIMMVTSVIREEKNYRHFGIGSWRSKIGCLMIPVVLATIIAGFRAGTTWQAVRSEKDPWWFDSKWAFYVFGFSLEIPTVYSYFLLRMDLQFHFHNKAPRRGDAEKGTHMKDLAPGSSPSQGSHPEWFSGYESEGETVQGQHPEWYASSSPHGTGNLDGIVEADWLPTIERGSWRLGLAHSRSIESLESMDSKLDAKK